MNVGIIGFGTRMNYFLDRLFELELGVRAAAVATLDPDKARSSLAEKGIDASTVRFYADADEMLDREQSLDGVLVGTRCSLHAEMAIKVMRRGLPLFLEKPVAITYEDLRLLAQADSEFGPEVVVSFPLRNTPMIRLAKEIIDSGRLGTIEHVQAVNNVPYGSVYYHTWYRDEEQTGGLFLQKATHDLDYINYLLGLEPVSVAAMASKQIFKGNRPANLRCRDCGEFHTCPESPYVLKHLAQEPITGEECAFAVDTGNHDSASVLVRYESGMHAVYTQNFYSRKSAARRGARLTGYGGTLEFDWYRDELKVHMHHTPRVETHKLETFNLPHFGGDAALALNFVNVMKGREKSGSPLSSGILSAMMCWNAEQSAVSGTYRSITRIPAGPVLQIESDSAWKG